MANKRALSAQADDLRRRAEDQHGQEEASAQQPLSPEQMQQQLHELRVQQVELEMRNEEMRRTQHELEVSRARYFDLYDLAPVGYLTLDGQGLILEANLTAVTMLGMQRHTLLRQPLTRFFLPEEQDVYYLQRKQLYATATAQSWDMRMLHCDGSQFWAHLQAIPAQNGECRITLEDITSRYQAESIMAANLRLSEYAVSHSLDELLTKVVDEAEIITGSNIGFFHFLEQDQVTLQLQAWSTNTLKTMCTAEGKGQHYPVDKAGVWVECIHAGRPVIHNDYAGLRNRKGLPQGHAPVERELVAPLFRGNLIVAVIGVGNKPTDYLEQDIEAVSRLMNSSWDIVSGKRVTESLRSASVYARTLIEASLDPLVTISADGTITDVNEASVRVTGVPREQMIGTDFSVYFTDPEKAREGYLRVFSDGVVHDYPLVIRHVNGTITDVLYNATIYRDEQGDVKGVFAAARDVTDRNRVVEALQQAHDQLEARVAQRTSALEQANEQMKKVSFELVWAEERERERIAGELHDQVGQSLLLAKMKLDALSESISSDSLRSYAEDASSLVGNSIHDIRSLTFRMRPPILDTAGIATALEWLCSSISNDYNLQVDFSNDGQPKPLTAEVRYSLYQTVRELLLNVVKHARTQKAQLSMKTDNHTLVVQVADEGIGFNPPDAILKHVNKGGYGLYNVQQRIEQMSGRFAVESAPGRGTSVTLMVPFTES